ncbi:Carbon-nitrogen hydrolase [Corchorus olitorius]|uniref:Carbon-nitrogen hydrolase n=1 Tax=Corchorus olitorius TaxID=93759 RepID=A0A1R3KAW7_9ROSI|nr:Carbon-nitrogen hydrolase [Corchorus olitorius]
MSMYHFYKEYWQPFGELLVNMEREGMLVDRMYLAQLEKVDKADDIQLCQLLYGGTVNRFLQNIISQMINVDDIDISPETLTDTDKSAYGTAFAAFGDEEKGREACHATASLSNFQFHSTLAGEQMYQAKMGCSLLIEYQYRNWGLIFQETRICRLICFSGFLGSKFEVGLCQLSVSSVKNQNLIPAHNLIKVAAEQGTRLVVLPEMWYCPYSADYFAKYSEDVGNADLTVQWKGDISFKESDFFVAGDEPTIVATADIIIGTIAIAIKVFTFLIHGGKLCKFSLVKFSKVHQPSYRKGSSTRLDFSPYSASSFKYWKGLLESVEFATAEEASECVVCLLGLEDGEEVWQQEAICYFCY